ILVPKKPEEAPRPVRVPQLATVAAKPASPQVATEAPPPPRPRPRRARPASPQPRSQTLDFVALDDRPIDNGVVMRVSWGPENLQADIIFGPDGSARAYRLVNASFQH